jgi:hypothetical protein
LTPFSIVRPADRSTALCPTACEPYPATLRTHGHALHDPR